ncbi:MAG: aldo/keto reductase [Caldilineaceae bacterium]|nr:aldo/keto reductase [Caldilineaceae bacterium]MDE0076753.1 aldo/keto reductase [Caldilineaceae bacterium]MDE0310847.1 aldo/keto reductase [Caldilineaceae bacterium]
MSSIPQRGIGNTGTSVTEFGLGTAPLGDLFKMLDEDSAQGVLQAAWDVGVRYFDTSPFYGNGKSEHRVGHFLRQKPRDEYVLSTKVGRVFRPVYDLANFDPGPFIGALPFEFTVDYSYDGIMRSFEDSLQRLSLPSVDLLVIHDLDFYFYETEARVNAYLNQLFTSGWRALEELRSHGLVKGVGAGINELGMIPRFLDLVELDFFLVAYGYNLLTQEMLEEEFPLCEQRGISVIIGAVFASGILATGAVPGATYFYAPASQEMMERTDRIEKICRRHQTPLPCAALQILLANPIVSAIIPGAMEVAHVRGNYDLLQRPIPAELWNELKVEGLLREDAPTP